MSWARTRFGSAPFLVDLVDRHHDRHAGRLGVVERLGGLRLHAVVGRDDQDREVGGLRTAGAHGGERLVTRGVDEGDLPLLAVDLRRHLVGTDVLGDAAGLLGDHVGVPDRVQELGLAVVDVTHDGDHRRPGDQVFLAALVLAEVDVERLEQLPVLLLGGDDLDVVVQLGAEQLQRLVVDRLGRGHHLAEVEQHLDQAGRVGVDLVREVRQRGAPAQPDDLALAARDRHAANRRGLHVVELLPPLPLRLAGAARLAAGTPEGTRGAAGPAAAAAATGTGAAARRSAAAAATGTSAAAGAAGPPPPGRGPPPTPAGRPGPPPGRGPLKPPPAPPGRGPRPAPGPPGPTDRRPGRRDRPRPPGGTACSSGSDAGRQDAGPPGPAGRGPPGRGPPSLCAGAPGRGP